MATRTKRVGDERLIKKYPNRRLYDTQTSTYVTLADIKQLVMASESFKVLDAKTDEDLTRSILLQIILEEEACGVPIFLDPDAPANDPFLWTLDARLDGEPFGAHHAILHGHAAKVIGAIQVDDGWWHRSLDSNDEHAKSLYAKSDDQLYGSKQRLILKNAGANARLEPTLYWLSIQRQI